jgi:hypothetical protein
MLYIYYMISLFYLVIYEFFHVKSFIFIINAKFNQFFITINQFFITIY